MITYRPSKYHDLSLTNSKPNVYNFLEVIHVYDRVA